MSVLSQFYNDGKPLKKGDIILYDGDRRACVEEIILPASSEAKEYNCLESGGLLIRFEDGVIVLYKFGEDHDFIFPKYRT